MLAAALGACMVALAGGPARAEDEAREFATLRAAPRPAPGEAVRAGPVLPLEWERVTRQATAFGPPPQRAEDAALLAAAQRGDWAAVEAALKDGRGDPRARGPLGQDNLLARAAGAGADAVVRLLLRRGALRDATGADGLTPLGAAALNGHATTVRLLLAAGADASRWSASGQTPMHLAAGLGRLAVLDVLLKAGVDPRAPNREGDNALDVAANRGQLDAMDRLLAAGVDPGASGR